MEEINYNEKDLLVEVEKLKNIIEINKTEEKNNIKKIKKNFNEIIAITGNYGSGKSLTTALLGKASKQFKTIIIDFDVLNNSINTLFRVPKYNKKPIELKDYIKKVNSKLHILCGIDIFFNEKNKISYEKIYNIFQELKQQYELILIDTSSETNLKYIKTILTNSDKILFLLEPNMIEIKKAKNLLDIYIKDWKLPIYKFKMILNKVNINSIDEAIVADLFDKIKIIGKINLSNRYTLLANNINLNGVGLSRYIRILNKI